MYTHALSKHAQNLSTISFVEADQEVDWPMYLNAFASH